MKHLEGAPLIVRADASAEMGTGHLMRCLALAQAWKDNGGKVIFITACQNEGLLQRIRDEEFELVNISHSYPEFYDWDHTRNVLADCPGAWVVLDGYHFDEVYQQQVKEAGGKLLVIDDMAHLKHYYADIILNQNLHAEQLSYSCELYPRLLLGTDFVLLRREFLGWKGWEREIPEVARKFLVAFGGSDLENHTHKVINALQKLEIPGMEATVVIGASNPHLDLLKEATRESRIPVSFVQNTRNMPELMAWADLAVSAAGTTTWEHLFLGTPTLLLISAENQRCIAEEAEREQAGRNLGRGKDLSVETLAEALTEAADNPIWRKTVSENAKKEVDGQGTNRVLAAFREVEATNVNDTKGTLTDQVAGAGGEDGPARNIFFLGGKQAGCIGLLTLAAAGCEIMGAVAYDSNVQKLAAELNIPTFSSLDQPEVKKMLAQSDLLVCVHGREIVGNDLLGVPHFGGMNVHPCLYGYKGADPVGRLLKDGRSQASVGVHRMSEKVDEGEVLAEEFVDVTGKATVEEVYNTLYPYYSIAILEALKKFNAHD